VKLQIRITIRLQAAWGNDTNHTSTAGGYLKNRSLGRTTNWALTAVTCTLGSLFLAFEHASRAAVVTG